MAKIHFLDVTNRDGVQTARTGLSKFGKTMVNFYLGKLGVAQSEIGFPFLFHEVPYVRANVALARAGAFGPLRLAGWCRAVAAEVEGSLPLDLPVETHCHNDLGMAVANSVSGALGDLDAGQDAWVNTCVNGIGERAGNADLLSCILAFSHGFGVGEEARIGDPIDLSWARRFGLWAAYAFGQPLPPAWPGVGRNAFAHESGIHADGALKDRGNYELYDDEELGPFPADWFTHQGRVVLTGGYGGKAGFRHVLDALGLEVADGDEDLVFSLVQLCASATGKPLTDDELRLITGYARQLALLFPGQLPQAG